MTKSRKILFSAAVRGAETLPLHERAPVYLAIAEFAGTEEDAKPFRDMAAAIRCCQELQGEMKSLFH